MKFESISNGAFEQFKDSQVKKATAYKVIGGSSVKEYYSYSTADWDVYNREGDGVCERVYYPKTNQL